MFSRQSTIYTPESSLARPSKMLREMIQDLVAGRELAWQLAVRDIRAQYRRAFLGILWAFILPLANTIIWVFLSSSGVIAVADTVLPYPLYVFTGTILWSIFLDAVNAPLQQTIAAKVMLTKLSFPREALIISGVYLTLFNAIIKLTVLLGVLALFGIVPNLSMWLFPFGVLWLVVAGTAAGLLVTPVGMLYDDIGRAMPLFMQFLMYVTPVVFPMPKEGWVSVICMINPLTPLILTTRNWLTGVPQDFPIYFIVVNAVTIILLLLVWMVYRVAMPILIERIGA